jgi:hypothetical protein
LSRVLYSQSKDMTPKLFISYSHLDERMKERLLVQLAPLKQTSKIDTWSDTRIGAGDDWEAEIGRSLAEAAIAVLLVTGDFLASEFIQTKEVPPLLDRCGTENLRLFPILAKDCAWELVPWLAGIQMRPLNGKPVWRRGGDSERELKLIAIEMDALAKIAQEAMEKAAQAAVAQEEIDRQRRAKESQLLTLVQSTQASIVAAENEDYRTALHILTQTETDRQKQTMQQWQILRDTQIKLFAVMKDVTIKGARSSDDAFKSFDDYIREA